MTRTLCTLATWRLVDPYLDEALDLDPTERDRWLAQLARCQPQLARLLGELLAESDVLREERYLETPIIPQLLLR